MDENEKRISDYIDALNAEQEPEEHYGPADTPELEKTLAAARLVRTLKEPALPSPDFPKSLSQEVADQIQNKEKPLIKNMAISKQTQRYPHRRWIIPSIAALAACLCLFILFDVLNNNVVYAMEKAVAKLDSYYGVLEVHSKNAAGDEWMVRGLELWSQGEKYAVKQDDGTMTINNGERKWQVRPESKEVAILPLLPDPTGSSFDLRDETKQAKQYPHKNVGTEMVAGRKSTKLEITPPGGLPYYLWVDQETNLPIQLQTPMQNALQTTYTFVNFEPNARIKAESFAYRPPKGYKVIEEDPGQLVATIEDAVSISKFMPLLPKEAPQRILAFQDRIVLDYDETIIVETAAKGSFNPAPESAQGTAAEGPLEVMNERLRWRQNGLEIQVEGPKRVELAQQIAADLTLPDAETNLADQAQIKVPVELEIVKANQQQVDRGSSPWQLDPLQVAFTFVNLQVSPEGITGEPEIQAESFKLITNNGVDAEVEVTDGPTEKVYLKRLVRQDETGIWTVVGYNPR
jgi:outer membrane lipoprotein-sorting protein